MHCTDFTVTRYCISKKDQSRHRRRRRHSWKILSNQGHVQILASKMTGRLLTTVTYGRNYDCKSCFAPVKISNLTEMLFANFFNFFLKKRIFGKIWFKFCFLRCPSVRQMTSKFVRFLVWEEGGPRALYYKTNFART